MGRNLFACLCTLVFVNSAFAVTLTGATASSEAFPDVAAGKAIDGNPNTFWASIVHGDAFHTEWIAVEFDSTIPLAGVKLTPRTIDSTAYAYPRDYYIEYSYDANGDYWFPVSGATFEDYPTPTGIVTHNFSGDILARRMRITATELSTDDYGNYYFQLAEIEPIEGTTVFPFETSVGEAFDAQLNMMWSIYGTINDGTNAVYTLGNEPCYYEMMALKYCWSKSTEGLSTVLRDDRIADWPQSDDGYMWSWSDHEPWPGVPPTYHNENNAKYILGMWRIWTWERDGSWFDHVDNTTVSEPALPPRSGMSDISSGMTMREKLRLAMQYLEQELRGNLGGITIEDNGMNNGGTVDSDPTNYWDNWKFGYKNAYDNIYYYAALEAMAQMEEHWGDLARAAQLRSYRSGCKSAYNSEFWDATKGRYVCTIDTNAVTWDFGSAFVNLEALSYGLGDTAQAQDVFDWLDGNRVIPGETSTGSDIYHWAFAPRSNTVAVETIGPPYWWADAEGAISLDGNSAWPKHLENGGAIFYVSYFDLMARIKYLGADNALARLSAIVDEFEIDQLRRDPAPGGVAWQLGIIGEFPESGLVPCAVLYGLAGIEPSAAGLNIAPNLPTGWTSLKVRQVRWAGALLDITLTPSNVTIASDSSSTRPVYVHQTPIQAGETRQFDYEPEGNILLLPEAQAPRAQPDGIADRVAVHTDENGNYFWSVDRTETSGWGDGAADDIGFYGDDSAVPLLGDVNGDGFADRVLVEDDGLRLVFQADYADAYGGGWGDGATDLVGHFDLTAWTPINLGDVDSDGLADRVVIAHDASGVLWYWDHNDHPADFGDGTSDHLAHAYDGLTDHAPIGVADVNGDGHVDRVLNVNVGGVPNWDLNLTDSNAANGTGGLTTGDWGPGPAADQTPYGDANAVLLLGDVDGDGRADRVVILGDPHLFWAADLSDGTSPNGYWGNGVTDATYSDDAFGEAGDRFLLGDVLTTVIVGDMNCDGAVDNFDIDPFVMALTDPGGYAVDYPNCGLMRGDINGDGSVDNFDISPFVVLLMN